MRTKVTLVLIFLNVALFFFIFNFERGWRTERASLEARRRVLGPEAADIRSLEITRTNPARTISLVRRAEGWFLTEPIDWPANPNAVSRILNELQFLEHETSFAVKDLAQNNQSLADYGLEQPSLTVTFTSGDPAGKSAAPAPITLRIGDTTKVGNRLYVLSPDGSRVHVVSRALADSLSLPVEQLRAETIFTIPVFEVRSLNLQTAAPANLRIRIRREGNRWSFETPILTRASKSATELTINSLNALRVANFLPRSAAETLPSASPSFRLTLEGNNRRETLLLGDPVDPAKADAAEVEYFAQLEDRNALFTVVVPRTLMETLRNAQEKLREPRLLDFDATAVTSITIAAPNQPDLTLQRDVDSSAWQLVRRATGAPRTQTADAKIVQRLLEQLSTLSAQRFLSDAPSAADLENWGFNRPEREVTLNLAPAAAAAGQSPTSLKLQIGTSTDRDGRAYARLANAPFVYLVDPEILRETNPNPLHYRDRLLRQLPDGARITALSLTSLPGKNIVYARELKPDETWETALAGETPARQAAVQAVLDQLRTLRAKDFVVDSFPSTVLVGGEERPWKLELTATISLVRGAGAEQTNTTTTLDFTERIGGTTQLAGSAEFGTVFSIEQPLLDALWTLTYGERDPGPAPVPAAPPKS